MSRFTVGALALLMACISATGLSAQNAKPAPETSQGDAEVTPLQVDIVVTRWQGERKVSSQPYTLSVNTGRPGFPASGGFGQPVGPVTRLRVGTQVPVTSTIMPPTPKDATVPPTPTTGITYREIGMQIDCSARPLSQDSRFELQLSLSESGVAPGDKQTGSVASPVFTNFSATNNLLLRDGQTRQFVVATDRISGEVVKADVTLKVVK